MCDRLPIISQLTCQIYRIPVTLSLNTHGQIYRIPYPPLHSVRSTVSLSLSLHQGPQDINVVRDLTLTLLFSPTLRERGGARERAADMPKAPRDYLRSIPYTLTAFEIKKNLKIAKILRFRHSPRTGAHALPAGPWEDGPPPRQEFDFK